MVLPQPAQLQKGPPSDRAGRARAREFTYILPLLLCVPACALSYRALEWSLGSSVYTARESSQLGLPRHERTSSFDGVWVIGSALAKPQQTA